MKRALAIAFIFFAAGTTQAQQFDMPRDQWLKNLKTILPDGFCHDPMSPFLRIYKGSPDKCVSEVERLFDFCATSEPRVILPERVTSIPQATALGQVMGGCVGAHYQGGAALDAFFKAQDLANKNNAH